MAGVTNTLQPGENLGSVPRAVMLPEILVSMKYGTVLKKHKQAGFTIVELLVVVLIIGVLAGVLLQVMNPAGIRGKARDSQRTADLGTIQTALELYFSDNRNYPTMNCTVVNGSNALATALEGGGYLNDTPEDPDYRYRSNGGDYVLTAKMEVTTSATESPCTSLNNWSSLSCGTADSYCYGVENP